MQELRALETSELIDMLSKYTADYTKMLNDSGITDQYEKCKLTIKALQAEIEFRKNSQNNTEGSNTTVTTPPDFS